MTSILTFGLGSSHLFADGYGPAEGGGVVLITTLRQAVYARLAVDPQVQALVGTRVYFGVLPQSASLLVRPAITFWVVSRDYGHHLQGSDGTSSARVQISAHSTAESVSDQIATAVRALWDGYSGTIGTVQVTASIQQGEADLPRPPKVGTDQWTYEIATDFKVNHRVSIPFIVVPGPPAEIPSRGGWMGAWGDRWMRF